MTGTTGKPRGPYARTAQRRRDIARAVLDIVVEKGHGSVTTAEVARRSGTREATVMYHFPTKDHLLVAALRQDQEDDLVRYLAGSESDVLDLDGLRAYARALPRRESIMRLYSALAGNAAVPGHPAQEYFAGHYRVATEQFANLIERRQAAGLAHPGLDPAQAARQVVATWDGLQAQWLVDPDFDLGELLIAAFRRLTGQNWMEARQVWEDPRTGL
ncbi:MAG TPA: TetR/AcrR family transcriptional regulator [Yinghuangia sp.]|uniref:TetR/AcrR family transcriptional regulator n=1 Tax=Yinghuangia sp. YIM S10712 TaxID=3436930 RepID=UPI002B92A264|nr:TetR/AcrR family transcriptional regulator [Yinghuangia sp.]